MVRIALVVLAALSATSVAVAAPLNCSEGGDWSGALTVQASFRTADVPLSVFAVACRNRDDGEASTRVWGAIRYLRDEAGREHRYAHPACIRVFSPQMAVLAGRPAQPAGADQWTVLSIDFDRKLIRVQGRTQAQAMADCQAPTAPTHFPGRWVSGTMTLD